jgi:hypothetical protein
MLRNDKTEEYDKKKNAMNEDAEQRMSMRGQRTGRRGDVSRVLEPAAATKIAAPQGTGARKAALADVLAKQPKMKFFEEGTDYSYQLMDDGNYAVFRGGKRTGTARQGSRAFDSIQSLRDTGKALPMAGGAAPAAAAPAAATSLRLPPSQQPTAFQGDTDEGTMRSAASLRLPPSQRPTAFQGDTDEGTMSPGTSAAPLRLPPSQQPTAFQGDTDEGTSRADKVRADLTSIFGAGDSFVRSLNDDQAAGLLEMLQKRNNS